MAKITSMKDIKKNVKNPRDYNKKNSDFFGDVYKVLEEARVTKDTIEILMGEKFDESIRSIAGIIQKDEKGKVKKDEKGNPIYKIDKRILAYGGEVEYEIGDKKIKGKRSADEIRHDLYDMIVHHMAKHHEKTIGDKEKKSMAERDYLAQIENKYNLNREEFVKYLESHSEDIPGALRTLSMHYAGKTFEATKSSLMKDIYAEDVEEFHKYLEKNAKDLSLYNPSGNIMVYDNSDKRKQVMTHEEAKQYVGGILTDDKKFISELPNQRYHTNRLKNNPNYDFKEKKKAA